MSETIQMDGNTKRFYQGVVSANQVLEAHQGVDFPDEDTRIKLFWFYVGALATEEHGCKSQEDFSNFLLGVSTRAPHAQHEDDE